MTETEMIKTIRQSARFYLDQDRFLDTARDAYDQAVAGSPQGDLARAAYTWIETEHPGRFISGKLGFILLCASLFLKT